jgi:hypothetical protein
MCPRGLNRNDINDGGSSYRNGTPITEPHNFGNPAPPDSFGNVPPFDAGNQVTWQPSPAFFGNQIGSASPAPTVASLDVTTGGITGGTPVIITGTGFQSGAEVLFGSEPATGVGFVSSTLLACNTPTGASGETVNVEVINTDSQSGTLLNAFTYWSAPAVTGGTASGGITGSEGVVFGTGFQIGATVLYGSNPATSVDVQHPTVIVCETPSGSSGETVNVTVENTDGQTGTLVDGFTYWSAPTITSGGISPNSGSTAGGTPVTITGTGFQTGAAVTFDGTSATSIVVSETEITCTTPAGSAGTATVIVTNSDGQSATDSTDFSYV